MITNKFEDFYNSLKEHDPYCSNNIYGSLEATGFSEPVSEEEALILSNSRRRGMLKEMLEGEKTSYKVGELSVQIAAWENSTETSEINKDERQKVYANLHQYHVPRMVEHDIIEYQQQEHGEQNIVRPKSSIRDFAPYLEKRPGPKSKLKPLKEDSLTLNQGYELISSERRRKTLQILEDNEHQKIDFTELTNHITELENNEYTGHRERTTVYTSLRQTHLPKLDDTDIIDFDKNRGTVEEDTHFASLVQLLPELEETETEEVREKAVI